MDKFSIIKLAAEFNDFGDAVKSLIDEMFGTLIGIATALTVLWGIFLGFKFWTASGDEQKTQSAKKAVWSFVIGIFVIFVVIVGAPILISALVAWQKSS